MSTLWWAYASRVPLIKMLMLAVWSASGFCSKVFTQVRTVPLWAELTLPSVTVDTSDGLVDNKVAWKSQNSPTSPTTLLLVKQMKQSGVVRQTTILVEVVQLTSTLLPKQTSTNSLGGWSCTVEFCNTTSRQLHVYGAPGPVLTAMSKPDARQATK